VSIEVLQAIAMQTTVMALFSRLWLSRLMIGLTPLPLPFVYLLSDVNVIPDDTLPALTPVNLRSFTNSQCLVAIIFSWAGVTEAADLLKLLLDADCHNDWSLTIGHSLFFVQG
jgi:hypothetical protein